MTPNDERTATPTDAPIAKRLVGDLAELGRLWSRHGLGVATSALQTAAATLKTTAATLHDLRSRLED